MSKVQAAIRMLFEFFFQCRCNLVTKQTIFSRSAISIESLHYYHKMVDSRKEESFLMSPARKEKASLLSHAEEDAQDEAEIPPRIKGIQRHTGLLLALLSQFLYATMALFYKLLTTQSPENQVPASALQVIFIRMAITWAGCILFMLATKTPDPFFGPKEIRVLLAFRGLFGFISLYSLYFSLEKLSLAVSMTKSLATCIVADLMFWL
jgi:hypothetical protein